MLNDEDGNVYIATQVDGVETIQALSELLLRYSYGRVRFGHDTRAFDLRVTRYERQRSDRSQLVWRMTSFYDVMGFKP